MRLRWLLVLAACAPASPPRAIAWPAATFLRDPDKSLDFGGFQTKELADKSAKLLLVQPAWGDGQRLGYIVSEIWVGHPDLWVQPVYNLKPVQAETIFSVDIDSTFYSPYWRAWRVSGAEPGNRYVRVSDVNALPRQKGPLVVCPIVPDGMGLGPPADLRLRDGGIEPGVAFVNGHRVEYFSFGPERQAAEPYAGGDLDGVVRPAELYLFAARGADGGRELLRELPAVLPEDTWHHAYVRRVDVLLEREAVFVPAGDSTGLREKLRGLGVNVPAASVAIAADLAETHRGHVAIDGSCFESAAGFPASCEWLDSEAALDEGIPASRHFATDVTLTANPVYLR